MRSFKKAKVVMLPTNQKSRLFKGGESLNYLSHAVDDGEGWRSPQHLYIISDDEIKESDYCYSYKTNKIVKATCDVSKKANKNIGFWKKVIATTDNSLQWLDESERNYELARPNGLWKCLPQPSQQFIQKFVEEYNKGNVITDVLVEYNIYNNPIDWSLSLSKEESHYLHKMYDIEKYDIDNIEKDWKRVFELEKHNFNKLKINLKDNTIIIKN